MNNIYDLTNEIKQQSESIKDLLSKLNYLGIESKEAFDKWEERVTAANDALIAELYQLMRTEGVR